jgi:hypothetical protein
MEKKQRRQPITFRTSQENIDYLDEIATINRRSISTLVDWGITYVIEHHRRAGTGNQTGLEVLQLLGSAKTPSNGSTNSGLLCKQTANTKEQTK